MTWVFIALVALYCIGFSLILVVNLGGPVTLGLALFRAAVWPVYLASGWPYGQRARID